MSDTLRIRPIEPYENAAMAAIIRAVAPKFAAAGLQTIESPRFISPE